MGVKIAADVDRFVVDEAESELGILDLIQVGPPTPPLCPHTFDFDFTSGLCRISRQIFRKRMRARPDLPL
jgi:hypothetical protein